MPEITIKGVNDIFRGTVKVDGMESHNGEVFIRIQTVRSTANKEGANSLGNQAVYASKEQALAIVKAILKQISEIEGNSDAKV